MYRERPSTIPGAVAWWRTSDGRPARVLPDGCMDLLWIGDQVEVAGPDTTSFVSQQPLGTEIAGLRFPSGVAPAVLGLPAHVLRDLRVPLADVWDAAEVRRLEDVVAAAPSTTDALEALAMTHGRAPAVADPLIADVVRRARAGERVAAIAAAVGLSDRQLQRRAQDAFGYGPKLLARILRLGEALSAARSGAPLATVAAQCGYADQAHLADDVRALTGTTLGHLGFGRRARPPVQSAARAAKRSTALPSGSSTVA